MQEFQLSQEACTQLSLRFECERNSLQHGNRSLDFCYENSKRLNDNELNSVYKRVRDEKYPKPYKLELQNLKSNLEATQSNFKMTKSDLMFQREKNVDLERRLLDLERVKEGEDR